MSEKEIVTKRKDKGVWRSVLDIVLAVAPIAFKILKDNKKG